jgi:hypothetical protein
MLVVMNSPSRYDVVWESPSGGADGSMPLGNGDICANVWIDDSGHILFYLSKTDAWDDYGRLVKVGCIRIRLDPPPPLTVFCQRLTLVEATVSALFKAGETNTKVKIWVDANHPVVHVSVSSTASLKAFATFEVWRTEPQALPSVEVSDVLNDDPQRRKTVIEPDTIIEDLDNGIAICHHNAKSVGPEISARIQGLDGFDRQDPLLGRTFGALVVSEDSVRKNGKILERPAAHTHRFDIYVATEHPSKPDEWLTAIGRIKNEIEVIPFEQRRASHETWWRDFWNRSWIHVQDGKGENDGSDAAVVSRGYALQRFINACAGRGRYPIKFNGSLFTVPYPGAPGGADYRRWGPGYWWQNTRLPYASMCTAGDFDLMRPLFRMYAEELMPYFRYRVDRYFGHGGAFIPECILFWGDVFLHTYGWTPYAQREDKLQDGGWHKREWVSGPELVYMMLDYYEHTMDERFLVDILLPAADDIILFFGEYYDTDDNGKLDMYPAQALETWWDCTNPMPEIAGLYSIIDRLLSLDGNLLPDQLRKRWTGFREILPEIPTTKVRRKTMLAPAAEFANKRNSENPELYAVFPFRLFAFNRPDVEWAQLALDKRKDRGAGGWRQDDIFMAYLGRAEEARRNIVRRARNKHEGYRFAAFWGPNYDWIPDQDHGAVLLKALQAMLLQTDGSDIFLLPAWPDDWDADFKLHAPHATVIEGTVRNGTLENLEVTPSSRHRDVHVMGGRSRY